MVKETTGTWAALATGPTCLAWAAKIGPSSTVAPSAIAAWAPPTGPLTVSLSRITSAVVSSPVSNRAIWPACPRALPKAAFGPDSGSSRPTVAVAPGILGVAAGAAGSGTGVIGGGVVEAPVWGVAATLWWTAPPQPASIRPRASAAARARPERPVQSDGRAMARPPLKSRPSVSAEPSESDGAGQSRIRGLAIVATPIGNAADITLRAIDVLKSADAILCEDTRVSPKLLARHGIRRPLVAYHEHNAERMRPLILERLRRGESLALISDAGQPLISDPGFKLVRAVLAEGLPVDGPARSLGGC